MRAILRDIRDAVSDLPLADGQIPSVGGIPDLMVVFQHVLHPLSPLANALRGLLSASEGSVSEKGCPSVSLSNLLAVPHKCGHVDAEFAFRVTAAAYDQLYRNPAERIAALALMAYLATSSTAFSALLSAWVRELAAVSRSLTDTLALMRCLMHHCSRPCASFHQAHCQRRAARVALAGVRHIAQRVRTALRCPALGGGGGPLDPDAAALCAEQWDLGANFRLWGAVAWAAGASPPPQTATTVDAGGNAGVGAVCALLATRSPAAQSGESSSLNSAASLSAFSDDQLPSVASLPSAGSGVSSGRGCPGPSVRSRSVASLFSSPATSAGAPSSTFALWNVRALRAAGDLRALVQCRTGLLMRRSVDPSADQVRHPWLQGLRDSYTADLRACLCGAAASAADALSLDRATHVVAGARLRAAVLARNLQWAPAQLSGPVAAAREAVLWHASGPPVAHDARRLAAVRGVRTIVPVVDTSAFAEAWPEGTARHNLPVDPGNERIALAACLLEAVAAAAPAAATAPDASGDGDTCDDADGGAGGCGDRARAQKQRAFALTFSMRPYRVAWGDGGVSGGLAAFADALCRGKAPLAGAGLLDPVQAVRSLARIRQRDQGVGVERRCPPAAEGRDAATGDSSEGKHGEGADRRPDLLLVVTGTDIRRALRACSWLATGTVESVAPSDVGAAVLAACAAAWAEEWRCAEAWTPHPPPPPHLLWANLHGMCDHPVVLHMERPTGGPSAAMGLVEMPGGRMGLGDQLAMLAEAAGPLVAGEAAPALPHPAAQRLLRSDDALAAAAADPRYRPRRRWPAGQGLWATEGPEIEGLWEGSLGSSPSSSGLLAFPPDRRHEGPVRRGAGTSAAVPLPRSTPCPESVVCAMGEVAGAPADARSQSSCSVGAGSGGTSHPAHRLLTGPSSGQVTATDDRGRGPRPHPLARCVIL